MKTRTGCLFMLIFLSFIMLGEAQEVRVLGTVYYQNSKCNACKSAIPVEGVRIKATRANKVISDNQGNFTLKFLHSKIGDPIKISIGEGNIVDLGNNEILELVNTQELTRVNIPSDPSLENAKIKIIICPKGERDRWAIKHYGIIYKSFDNERLKQLEKQNKALKYEKSKSNAANKKRVELLEKRITELEVPLNSVDIRINAFKLASVNKDDVSNEMKQFILAIEQGNPIKDALKFFDRIKTAERLNSIKSKPSRTELEFIAEQSNKMYDYETAIKCYIDLISYAEGEGLNKGIIASYYQDKCLSQDRAGQTIDAIESCKKAVYNYKKIGITPSLLSWSIGNMYVSLEKYDEAVTFYNNIIKINKSSKFPNETIVGFAYFYICELYYNNKDLSLAKTYLELFKKDSPELYKFFQNSNSEMYKAILNS